MNNTEQDTTQNSRGHVNTDGYSSDAYGSEMDSKVHPGPAGTHVWPRSASDVSLPEVIPHPQQYTVQPGMVDPVTLRFHCPCQSTQCQPDFILEPQLSQYHLLTGAVPCPADSNHHSSVSAPWFTNESILCSMMPGDLHGPLAGICEPQTMEHQQFQEVVCNVSGDRQFVLVNPCEPGSVFLTLESAATQRDDSPTGGEDMSVLGTSSQCLQTACSLYESRDQTTNMQHQAASARRAGAMCESKSRKPCHCSRSLCLKLYCECFASGVMCSSCDCSNCHNNAEHEKERHEAVMSCLGRNPDAFRSKIADGKKGEVKGWHNKGCNCKRSGCLKNYCECYEANIMCTSSCKCVGCRNYNGSSEMGFKEKTSQVKGRWSMSVITPAVVEAVCGCLLVRAEEAESEAQGPAQAEHMVLEDFGHCLSQIVKAMFKNYTP